MELDPEHEALVLAAVRLVPDDGKDNAWAYIADRLRPIREPQASDVEAICVDAIKRYGARN